MKKVTLILITLLMLSCSSDKSNNNGATQAEFYGSYEAATLGCTTDRHTYSAPSEEEILKMFCSSLKDDEINNNCASYQRNTIYKTLKCPEEWEVSSSGSFNLSSKQYSFSVDQCGTGLHFFTSSDHSLTMELYCEALQNEQLNRNCAKAKRDQEFVDQNCKDYLR